MQIRFKQDVQKGGICFSRGEKLELPKELAQQYIDDGDAVVVPKAERATRQRS